MPRQPSARQALLESSIAIFSNKGYAATSVQEIADAAGIRKGSVYKHIKTKEDLLLWILDAADKQTRMQMEEIADYDVSAVGRLREYLRRHIRWYLENVDLVNVFFREWRFVSGERRERVVAQRREYDRFVRGLIAGCQAAGAAEPDLDLKYASFYVLGAVNSWPDWYDPDSGESPEAIAADGADLALMTIGAEVRDAA
jgi:TetR/AcrR family transcriptional regulator, cholesterol catabolism regulator